MLVKAVLYDTITKQDISPATEQKQDDIIAALSGKLSAGGQGKVDTADCTTAVAITGCAAVASKYFYITSILISVAAAGQYWIEDDDAAQITCKFNLGATGGAIPVFFTSTPWKSTTVNRGLKIKGSVAGNVGIMLTYYTGT